MNLPEYIKRPAKTGVRQMAAAAEPKDTLSFQEAALLGDVPMVELRARLLQRGLDLVDDGRQFVVTERA